MGLRYAVDLARGWAPLTFDRDANPDGLEPALLADTNGPFLRLAVQRGAYAGATRGEPDQCDRCELRDPDKLPIDMQAWHGFSIRIPPGFPATPERFVAAQVKAQGGASPLVALRVDRGRLYVDWRIGAVTVGCYALGRAAAWVDVALGFAAGAAEVWVDGALVTSARANFPATGASRYLKLGPYRDKGPAWGDGAAAIDFRDIRRGAIRDEVLLGYGRSLVGLAA